MPEGSVSAFWVERDHSYKALVEIPYARSAQTDNQRCCG
jgi:hypothetical protein